MFIYDDNADVVDIDRKIRHKRQCKTTVICFVSLSLLIKLKLSFPEVDYVVIYKELTEENS